MASRVIVFPVDDSDDSQRSFDWLVANLFKETDEIHLIHVIPRLAYATTYVAAAVDFNPGIDRNKYEATVHKVEEFIVKRFLSRYPESSKTTPFVHIIKSETDSGSIGHVICSKAEELHAACVVMGNHVKGPVREFFMGSVSNYIMKHCKLPVLIARNI
ncbi:hypothetical protein CEUSTIGMA_g11351.t1 [Chlamydomonas eustigma]|uniref:UspA domain-containing protein n=1 Tax=Chlamydomonas eustigma TaxID=1157962 RepID=A0A250XLI4_9CHLO|nr:hypothetical protein CEUSTIGMA_g11351.t1 [Chlamydomonas eustigma]|eukprot:GAX83927.1 hypothetical protein CEUSTIGMA_g11351.t1 [Chlamydomonas eustigma]